MSLTGKDFVSTCKKHMPNWHKHAMGKSNIEIITELSHFLGLWKDIPKQGTSFKKPEVQTFLKILLKMIEDRGAVLDKFYVPNKEDIG